MIYLSAGHNPDARGAHSGDFYEHDEAVRWVEELYAHIGKDKAIYVPTGTLTKKIAFINQGNPTIAVEIHFNSLDSERTLPSERGCMSLYMPGSVKGKSLAEACQSVLAPLFPPSFGVREGYYQLNPSKPPDAFLADTVCPAVILEPDFIDMKERILLMRAEACEKLAVALMAWVG